MLLFLSSFLLAASSHAQLLRHQGCVSTFASYSDLQGVPFGIRQKMHGGQQLSIILPIKHSFMKLQYYVCNRQNSDESLKMNK